MRQVLVSQNKEDIRDFLASDEFVVVSMHRLFDYDNQMAESERNVRLW